MFNVGTDWNPKQSKLKAIIKKKDYIYETISLILDMHSMVHSSTMLSAGYQTFEDEVLEGLIENDFCIAPTKKDETIVWNIWHMTRIEDITANMLIMDSSQILDDEWLEKMSIQVKDTGNAMTYEEILEFSSLISKKELLNYRDAVGRQTQQIIKTLTTSEMKRKINKKSLLKVLSEGGVLDHPDSLWLLDFWGKKDIAGIIQMPITRHQIVHLNACIKIKKKVKIK